MSDLTSDHDGYLDQLGIGPNSPATPRQRLELAPTGLFAPPPVPIEEMNLTPLYPYQEAALEQIMAAIAAGKTRIMLMLPTGGGKTVLGAHILAHKSQRARVSAFFVPLLAWSTRRPRGSSNTGCRASAWSKPVIA
jgi:hypothetical protein